jgi:hypothetical protein
MHTLHAVAPLALDDDEITGGKLFSAEIGDDDFVGFVLTTSRDFQHDQDLYDFFGHSQCVEIGLQDFIEYGGIRRLAVTKDAYGIEIELKRDYRSFGRAFRIVGPAPMADDAQTWLKQLAQDIGEENAGEV